MKKLVEGIASAYGCTVDGEEITPLYESYLNNSVINRVLRKYLEALGYTVREVDEGEVPSGSTDEANVSRIVPTGGHIDVGGIAPPWVRRGTLTTSGIIPIQGRVGRPSWIP
ncbi:hypothetical protein [Thermogymnomonas acidicola]|uniref:hypothetical protein n=1 Tax=Thermogymnomonas acidicola TaxID=399579 RepID=UPI00094656F3|nr:hypothetical protein [Thermogymnomonas acidicola]